MTENAILEQLKTEEDASFELLYKFYFPSIALYVRQNMGKTEDAEDIFQEAIIILLQKVRQPDFVLTSSLKTYLYAISKNLWMKHLRDNHMITVDDIELILPEEDNYSIEVFPEKSNYEKVTSWLTLITENCQYILKAIFFYREPLDSVMKKMNWKNKHTAANQQYKCIQQLKREKEKER